MPGSPSAMRVSILPPSRPLAAISRGRVGGEAVVELEDRALQAAAVHRADDHLALQGAEQQQVVEDVGGAEHAVDARARERGREAARAGRCGWPSPSLSPRTPSAPRAGWSAATSSRRPSSPTSRRRRARGPGLRDAVAARATRISVRSATVTSGRCHRAHRRHRRDRLPAGSAPRPRRVGRHGGGALEPRRRRWPRRRWRTRGCARRSQPASRPWHSAPPKASPAPRPLTTSTGNGGTSTRSSRVAARTPLGPCLTTASSTPRSSSASAARCGSVSPTATSHSSRLPTATVTCSRALPTCGAGLVRVRPEHRPVVEVEHGVPCAGRGPARRRSGRCARRLLRQAGDGRPRRCRRRGWPRAAARRPRSCRSGAIG